MTEVEQVRQLLGTTGKQQLIHRVAYDAVGAWQKAKDLGYWHCLDDTNWQTAPTA